MIEHQDDKLLEEVNSALDESVHGLDAEMQSKLNQARQRALAVQKGHGSSVFNINGLMKSVLPLGGLAGAALVMLFWVVDPKGVNGPDIIPFMENDEVNFVESYWEEDPDLLEEMEFVAWLMDDEMMGGAMDNIIDNTIDNIIDNTIDSSLDDILNDELSEKIRSEKTVVTQPYHGDTQGAMYAG